MWYYNDYYESERIWDRWWSAWYKRSEYVAPTYTDYYNKYQWASTYSYVKPDYKIIREKLLEKQKKMNKLWFPIKIAYWRQSTSRRNWGLIKISVESVDEVDKIRKVIDQLTTLWIKTIDGIISSIIRDLIDSWGAIPSSYDDFMKLYEEYKAKHKEKDEWDAKWGWKSRWWNWAERKDPVNMSSVSVIKNSLLWKIKVKDTFTIKNASYTRWNRINRWYISKQSSKPLINVCNKNATKKNVLAIVDWSGSMSSVIDMCSEFMYWLYDTWIFNLKWYFSTEDTIVWNDMVSPYNTYRNWWWEWFDTLAMKLEDMEWNNDYDYIFIFTDCKIANDQLQEIYNMVEWKKHILFNFSWKDKWDNVKWMFDFNIKNISNINDMISALVNYV